MVTGGGEWLVAATRVGGKNLIRYLAPTTVTTPTRDSKRCERTLSLAQFAFVAVTAVAAEEEHGSRARIQINSKSFRACYVHVAMLYSKGKRHRCRDGQTMRERTERMLSVWHVYTNVRMFIILYTRASMNVRSLFSLKDNNNFLACT